MVEHPAVESVRGYLQSALAVVKKVPEWGVLRASTVTGARPGAVVVFLLAAVVGAIAAVAVTGTVYLAGGRSAEFRVESAVDDGGDVSAE